MTKATGSMRGEPSMHGGAIWCDQHGRWECNRNKKQVRGGGRCHSIAIAGIDACRMHSGVTAELAKAKGDAITAWSALTGDPTVSAVEAVSGMLEMSWLRVHLYAGLLEEQVTAAQEGRGELLSAAGGEGGPGPVGAGEGLVGHTFSAMKDVGIYASGEAIRALAQLEAAERDRCVRYGKTSHDMGISEQEIEISRQQGVLLADAVQKICAGLLQAVLGVLDAQAGGEALERVVTAMAAEIRRSWPVWLGEIAPREFRAIGGVA